MSALDGDESVVLSDYNEVKDSVSVFPATVEQSGLWYIQQTHDLSYAYNEQMEIFIEGNLTVQSIEYTLNKIIERHRSLRTVFRFCVNGYLEQVVEKAYAVSVEHLVAGREFISRKESEAFVKKIAEEQGQYRFDLAAGPLIKVCLIAFDDSRQLLILTYPHIVGDGFSAAVFMRDFKLLIMGYCQGYAPELPDIIREFSYFSQWEKKYLLSEQARESTRYWNTVFKNPPPILNLPYKTTRDIVSKKTGKWHSITIDKALFASIEAARKSLNVSINVFLLAALKVLISLYSNETDIVVGSLRSNRRLQGLRNTLGYFVNTVAIRTQLDRSATFADTVCLIKKSAHDACYKYYLPYTEVVDIVRKKSGNTKISPCQIALEYRNFPFESFSVADTTVNAVNFRSVGDARFDITFSFSASDQQLRGHIKYDTELFCHETIEALGKNYLQLLGSVCEDVNRKIYSIDYLADTGCLVKSDKRSVYSTPCVSVTVTALFEEQVRIQPQAIAFSDGVTQVTYDDLNKRSNQFARLLLEKGIEVEDKIGLYAYSSIHVLTAALAVLKAGGVLVPVDPGVPLRKVMQIHRQCGIKFIITDADVLQNNTVVDTCFKSSQFSDNNEEMVMHFIGVDQFPQVLFYNGDYSSKDLEHYSGENLMTPVSPDNLAYILYTSGTTGQPKGAMIQHQALMQHIAWKRRVFNIGPADNLLHKTPLGFDVSMGEWLTAIAAGAKLTLAKPHGVRDPYYLAEFINQQNITVLQIVPVMIASLVPLLCKQRCISVRAMFCGGEKLNEFHRRILQSLKPSFEFYNFYGPTETTIDSSYYQLSPHLTCEPVPIGLPVDGATLYVLDKQLNQLPTGVAGELYIGGNIVGRGYVNSPESTAVAFVPDPYSDMPGARMYKTGDLVKLRSDGQFEFIGRINTQKKINGVRVDMLEIENLLLGIEEIKNAVVIVQENESGYNVLTAWISLDGDLDVETIKNLLQADLPESMIPAKFIVLDQFPLLYNGKIDRQKLSQPQFIKAVTPVKTPETQLETRMASVWAEILNVNADTISIDEDFFSLGGNSILVLQLAAQMRKKLNMEISITEIVSGLTVKKAAQLAEKQHKPVPLKNLARLHGKRECFNEMSLIRGIQRKKSLRSPVAVSAFSQYLEMGYQEVYEME